MQELKIERNKLETTKSGNLACYAWVGSGGKLLNDNIFTLIIEWVRWNIRYQRNGLVIIFPTFPHLLIFELVWGDTHGLEVSPTDGAGSMARVDDMLQKMMRRFAASDEHAK